MTGINDLWSDLHYDDHDDDHDDGHDHYDAYLTFVISFRPDTYLDFKNLHKKLLRMDQKGKNMQLSTFDMEEA